MTLVENLHVAGAVHRFQRVDGFFAGMFFVHFDDEHVLLVLFPVAGCFPQFAVHDLRCVHLDIAACALLAAHVVLQFGVDRPAVRVPEDSGPGLLLACGTGPFRGPACGGRVWRLLPAYADAL